MLEKKKKSKTKILCMLFLVTAILAGSATAYARTVTDSGKSFYKTWTYTFVGEYNSTTKVVSGSTSASFDVYRDSYTEVKAYSISPEKMFGYRKVNGKKASCYGNAGNIKNVRVQHHAYYRKEGSSVGGHTIY